MRGAVSNQIVKCIIYTSDIDVGRKKLLEIENEKEENGISIIIKTQSSLRNETVFSDGEEWIIVNPNDGARGYRWRKAWVDVSNTTIAMLHRYIKPYGGLYKWENEKYFNW